MFLSIVRKYFLHHVTYFYIRLSRERPRKSKKIIPYYLFISCEITSSLISLRCPKIFYMNYVIPTKLFTRGPLKSGFKFMHCNIPSFIFVTRIQYLYYLIEVRVKIMQKPFLCEPFRRNEGVVEIRRMQPVDANHHQSRRHIESC